MSSPDSDGPSLTYREAGVDIDAGNALVERIKPAVAATRTAGVIGGLGGFGGLFRFPVEDYREPLLVAGADGVGTKLKLALQHGRHHAIGVDLVAMSVNDVLVQGAQPLFFLDYFATARLDPDVAAAVIEGVAAGCREAGAALLGGETAEMPGLYAPGDYDVAGFCVGVVERDELLDGTRVTPGDRVLGLASSGPHANGFSLIRRLLETHAVDPAREALAGTSLAEALLAPTRIYVRALRAALQRGLLHAAAHITGGGLPENLPRVLPPGCAAHIDTRAWPRQPVFDWIQERGNIDPREMLRTFNCGVGMALVVAPEALAPALACCAEHGLAAWEIGAIHPAAPGAARIELD